jgi:two-component system, NarL family, sensor histidine kinase DesK
MPATGIRVATCVLSQRLRGIMTSLSLSLMLRSLRRAPPRAHEAHAWPRYVWLMYLVFLFMPALFPLHEHSNAHAWLRPTLLTLPVFCALYIWSTRQSGRSMVPALLGTALLDYVLFPLNPFANVYLIYTAALLPFALAGFLRPLLVTLTLLTIHATEVFLLGYPPISAAFTALLSIGCCLGNSAMMESRLKTEALQLSHQEIRRLATLAERERIGRDLHDLLGHTLSLIAIKSELAGKLMARDRDAAVAEVADVTRIARDALKQVRIAVTGMRTAALEGEFASARALLESSGLKLVVERDVEPLPVEIETALAMIVREATTNIQRHADAHEARIEVRVRHRGWDELGRSPGPGEIILTVSDDGLGGITRRGTGLAGIGERARSLGGTLEIDSPRGKGTVLRARFPLDAASQDASPAVSHAAVEQAVS